uniref:Uncharacterized protein n=1 Tax=Romanomermis culicivorax TaxID=13658 RepID=A0A915JDC6_ROMCU
MHSLCVSTSYIPDGKFCLLSQSALRVRQPLVLGQNSNPLVSYYNELIYQDDFGFPSPKTKLLDHGQAPPLCSLNMNGDNFLKHRRKRIVDGRTPEPYQVPWVGLLVKDDPVEEVVLYDESACATCGFGATAIDQKQVMGSDVLHPDNYAGIFYTLMGYFSTIQGTDLNDQVSSELIKTFNILITGSDYDRFYVLIMAKTMVSERLTGRLFYFHLNENAPFLTDHFSMSDIDIIYHYLRIKKGQLGINSNEQPTEKCFVVDATFYRTINLFRRDRLDATLWRKLKMTNLIGKNTKHHFFQLSKQIYNALFIAFMKNSNPTSNGGPLKFILSKEHFLRFVHGALQYSIKIFYLIKITPIYVGSYLEKLAILEYNQKNWVADSPPIIFEAHESFHEASMAQTATKIDDLPIDFSSNAEFALINTVIFGLTNDIESAQFSTKQVQIENKSGLIHLLEQTIKLENDQYYQKFFEVRKELLLQLSRIDAFLGHEHRTSYLRHFIFGALITAGLENPAFKLKHRFDELNPVDIFLIKSSESSGHCFSKMMIDQHEQHERSTLLQNELTYHSMGPNSLREFEAQMKGFAAGQQIFTPYGYDQAWEK